jgi:hypothetical protein
MVLVITGALPRKGSDGQREMSVKLATATYTPISTQHRRMFLKGEKAMSCK